MRLPTSRRVPFQFWILLTCVLAFLGQAAPSDAASGAESRLEDFFTTWQKAASPWMMDAERRLFEELTGDVERELFLHAFWAQRDGAYRDGVSHHGDFLSPSRRFYRRLDEALARFEDLDDPRAQALLLAGAPLDITHLGACADVLRPLEVWSYRDDYVVFFTRGTQRVLWSPADGAGVLMFGNDGRWTSQQVYEFFDRRGCWRSRHGATVDLQAALDEAVALETWSRRTLVPPSDPTWPDTFRQQWQDGQLQLPIPHVDLVMPGRYQQKTILEGRFEIPPHAVGRNAEGHLFDRLVTRGDIWWGDQPGGRLVDSFQVTHYVAGGAPSESAVPLSIYRRLRPGTYTVDLRLEERHGLALARHREILVVPRLEDEASPPAGYAKGFAGLTRSEVGVLHTLPSIEVLSPGERLLVGEIWVEAVTTGGPIQRVDFLLDGDVLASDDRSPYAARVDFGDTPRARRLKAVAYDPMDQPLVWDERQLDVTSSRFAVHLVEPARGTYAVRAKALVETPPDATLESVELFVDDVPFGRFVEPPFKAELPPRHTLPATQGPRFVRAVATLTSGEQAEDLVLIDASNPSEEIDVQLVQLYASVLDVQGRPVQGLTAQDFTVYEDGQPQALQRFDTVENLAINVALLMDTSSSMRRQLDLASRSARTFFETVLTPKDQASLLVFNDDIRQAVPFTSNVEDLLTEATGFRAWGTTRLHDSLIFTMHSFGGLDGKRALVLLSDGQDVNSDFPFDQVLEAALKSRIAVYPIVLGLEDTQTLENLQTLADETGGRFFAIGSIDRLDRVYRRIEEDLRSQYLLVYEPPPRTVRGELRRVRVEMAGEGLRARTLTAYYP